MTGELRTKIKTKLSKMDKAEYDNDRIALLIELDQKLLETQKWVLEKIRGKAEKSETGAKLISRWNTPIYVNANNNLAYQVREKLGIVRQEIKYWIGQYEYERRRLLSGIETETDCPTAEKENQNETH